MNAADVTVLVKVMDRPECLSTLLASVRRRAGDVAIIVGDDGREQESSRRLCFAAEAEHLAMPFDAGIAATRNALVDRAATPLVMVCDDDCVFTAQTDVGRLAALVERYGFDVLGARLLDRETNRPRWDRALLIRRGDVLYALPREDRFRADVGGCQVVHFVENCFVARRASLLRVRHDPRLKLRDHVEFFWRARLAGLLVAYCPDVSAEHWHRGSEEYEARKARNVEYRKLMLEIMGLAAFRRLANREERRSCFADQAIRRLVRNNDQPTA